MAKKRVIEVQTFGLLTHRVGDLWERQIELTLFGQKCSVPMLVNIPKNGGDPEPNQIEAYNNFNKDIQRILRSTESAIVKHYGSLKRGKGTMAQDEAAKVVKLIGVMFPYARKRPTFGFLFNCDWDEENGLAVKFEDGQIAEVGPQDIVL